MASKLSCVVLLVLLAVTARATNDTNHYICPHDSSDTNKPKSCTSDKDCKVADLCAMCPGGDRLRCYHTNLFPHFEWPDVVGSLVLVLAILAAAMAGIGGGGMNVPIFLMLFMFELTDAKILSHVTIFGNSLSQLIINSRKRLPDGRHVIDYRVALVLLPTFLAGHDIGVTVFPLFPPFLVLGLLMTLLIFATWRTGVKGFKMWKQESRKGTETGPLIDSTINISAEVTGNPAVLAFERSVPWKGLFYLSLFWGVFVVDYFLTGSKKKKSIAGVKMCSAGYWGFFWMPYPVVLFFAWYGAKGLSDLHTQKVKAGYVFPPGELQWTKSMLIKMITYAWFIGMAAGLVGIGGGEFLSPLLLELGMAAQPASATSAFSILFTTSSDVVHYVVMGDINGFYDYAGWCFAIGLGAALFGRSLAMKGKSSVIILVLTGTLAVCAVLAAEQGVKDIVSKANDHEDWWSFTPSKLCG